MVEPPAAEKKRGPVQSPKQTKSIRSQEGAATEAGETQEMGNTIATPLPSTIPNSNATDLNTTQASSTTLMPDASTASSAAYQPIAADLPAPPRPRGRPKGSKDKPADPSVPRKRGRPKGSKDKLPVSERRRPRGRPRKYPKLDHANGDMPGQSPALASDESPEPLDAPSAVTRVPDPASVPFRLGNRPSTYQEGHDEDAGLINKQSDVKPPKRGRGRPRKHTQPAVSTPPAVEKSADATSSKTELDKPHISHRFVLGQTHAHGSISLSHFDINIARPAGGEGPAAASGAQLRGLLHLTYQGPADGGEAILPVGEELQFLVQGQQQV